MHHNSSMNLCGMNGDGADGEGMCVYVGRANPAGMQSVLSILRQMQLEQNMERGTLIKNFLKKGQGPRFEIILRLRRGLEDA